MNKVVQMRILFTGTVFVLLSAVLMVVTIPSVILNRTSGSGIVSILFVIILHLLILYAFRIAIKVNKRGIHLRNVVYVVSGIGLLLLGLFIMDGAFAFLGNHMPFVSISMFI